MIQCFLPTFADMRKYPVGLQSFKEVTEGEYVYADKTRLIQGP
jgi:Predicted AAA-ATPase.